MSLKIKTFLLSNYELPILDGFHCLETINKYQCSVMGSKKQKSITCFKSHKTLNYTCRNAEGWCWWKTIKKVKGNKKMNWRKEKKKWSVTYLFVSV